jgi:hypothetical protein
MPEPGLTDVQKAYNVAQSDMFQLAAYGHHRYHPSGEALTPEGKRQQRDYNDRLLQARDDLEAGLLRLVAEHGERYGLLPVPVVGWLRTLADDPGARSTLALGPDELDDEPRFTWVNGMPTCPNCGAKHIIRRLHRWPWRRTQWWRCNGCFTTYQAEKATL